MQIPVAIILMVFSMMIIFSSISSMMIRNNNTTVVKEKVPMVVMEMKEPRNFEVTLVDINGNKFKFEKQWCENFNNYYLGSVHIVEVETLIFEINNSGYKKREVIQKFELPC